ncbi:hypothetical protein PR048_014618 [Dryococelus australis]|uniref:AMP-dependent synthetase/ligase domain-containing protein n=1 Tax=Dryococelus australis TaxID=614101 RepID=A0ABQ9HEX6_9NEOP|nr:hypothetical protein PR048_014618 [Dryococelus australis]
MHTSCLVYVVWCRDGEKKRRPSYWHEAGPEPLAARTVGQLVDWAAGQWSNREAFISVYEGVRLTYRQVADKVRQLRTHY